MQSDLRVRTEMETTDKCKGGGKADPVSQEIPVDPTDPTGSHRIPLNPTGTQWSSVEFTRS